jgi:uncharacterized protein
MPFSLYDAIIPNYCQTLGAISGLVSKAEAHCAEHKHAPTELLQARLAPDMWPFADQVKWTAVHSIGAINGVRKGVFSPDMTPAPDSFAGLKTRIDETIATLKAIDPAEINGFIGRDMRFEFGERRMPFTAENFLLSFSQPNFYFHAVTTYDIMRHKGLALVKKDFMGQPRLKLS